jgi:chemotaxis protein MotB
VPARRGRQPEVVKENSERWLLTYADLITLLLAFFVIMYAISNTDVVKYVNLRGSLQNAFNVGVLAGEQNQSITSAGQISSPGAIPIVASPQLQSVQAQIDSLESQDGRFEQVVESVGQRPEGVYLRLAGSTTFVSGSADLTPEGMAALTQLTEIIRTTTNASNDIRVEGHTDDIPPGSDRFPTNWELSTARAVSVVRFLENAGMAPDRLGAFGYSDTRPLQLNNSEPNRRENRRVELVILQPAVDVVGRLA